MQNCLQFQQARDKRAFNIVRLLKDCAARKDLGKAQKLHAYIWEHSHLEKNSFIASNLVNMYAKCGAFGKVKQVFEELTVRDVYTWSALIAGYAQQRKGKEVLECFENMQHEGHSPDAAILTCTLKACGNIGAVAKGEQIHDRFVCSGMLESDVLLGSALVDMYTKLGALDRVQTVLQELPGRDAFTWTTLIAGYAQQGQGKEALKCYDSMQQEGHSPNEVTFLCTLKACGSIGAIVKGKEIHEKIVSLGMLEKDILLGSALVDMYVKCGALAKAQQVLQELPVRNVVTWNALLVGYTQHGQGEKAVKCLHDMQQEGHCPDKVTLTCALKACGTTGAAAEGRWVHDKIVNLGMLEKDIVLGSTLVDMYVKCDALSKAQEVFEELPLRNAVTWGALIVGYAEKGQEEEVLKCYKRMLCEGHPPDGVILMWALEACGCIGAAAMGEQIHEKIASLGILENNVTLGSSLVDMYVKCGALAKAQEVLEELPVRDVVTWTTVIAGYAQQGHGQKALKCFDTMQYEGHSPNVATFIYVLKACGNIEAVAEGSQIHGNIVSLGMLNKDAVLGSALVDMYAKCGALTQAQQVLLELPFRDEVTWSSLIAGYVQQGYGKEALKCFDSMQEEGHSPNVAAFSYALKACGDIGAIAKGEQLHDRIANLGMLEKYIVLGSTLVDMYAKCGAVSKAQKVLEELSFRDLGMWSALVAGYSQHGQPEEALKCYDNMQCEGHAPDKVTFMFALKACGSIGLATKGEQIHDKLATFGLLEEDIALGSSLVDMYAKCGMLAKAQRVLEELPVRNVVAWNVLIAGYSQNEQGEEALKCFDGMQEEGHCPDTVTFISALKACGSIGAVAMGKEIHDKIISLGLLENSIMIGNSLVDMYARCGALAKAQQVLKELPVRDVVTWSALISGYVQQGQCEEALKWYDSMQCEGLSPDRVTFICVLNACGSIGEAAKGEWIHAKIVSLGMLENDIVLGNALVDMYAKCGAVCRAQQVFEELPYRNIVAWNALIVGYAQQGQVEETLKCYDSMQYEGHAPDEVTFICVLKACGSIGAAVKGEQIHDKIISLGMLEKDTVLGSTLVDMYAKCAALSKAQKVLKELLHQNVVTWNALIGGYAQQGHGLESLNSFERMQFEGVKPDSTTLICVLKACSHSGLLNQAEILFSKMSTDYGIKPNAEHYCCLVDILGRVGKLNRALVVIDTMPFSDYLPAWIGLLGACRKWGEMKIGRLSFEQALHLDGSDAGVYVCMADIYAAAGMHRDAEKIEVMRVVNQAMGNASMLLVD